MNGALNTSLLPSKAPLVTLASNNLSPRAENPTFTPEAVPAYTPVPLLPIRGLSGVVSTAADRPCTSSTDPSDLIVLEVMDAIDTQEVLPLEVSSKTV